VLNLIQQSMISWSKAAKGSAFSHHFIIRAALIKAAFMVV